ncbi:RAQPRD family integrative conjugative element protein [Burkholderia sp. F1]|uniref:integrative conjugative element protein, RAQPRD family n=1 Tax=Burkholderia sp. F1 TaxID=3366817 RepID=UPI003D741542
MPLTRHHLWLPALALASLSPLANAGEAELRAELAVMARQLEGLERQAERGAALATANYVPNDSRYHFDFMRLRDDVRRIRGGVEDYLTPVRAQPRDPIELHGDYRQDTTSKVAP